MLIALEWAIGAGPMQGQTLSFFYEFSTPAIDRASAVAADASGIYVFANGPGSRKSGGVRKYDSSGKELWTRDFSAPANEFLYIVGAVADATGVYGVGYGSGGTLLRKYSAAGDELWTRHADGTIFALPGVAADATGVYVVMTTLREGSPQSLATSFVRKYSADGSELWTRLLDQAFLTDPGVAVDGTGVYVAGLDRGGSPFGVAFVRKYGAGGNELWTRQFALPPNLSLWAFGMAADARGAYVLGHSRFGGDFFLRKYDAGGNELWTRQVGAPYFLFTNGVAADTTGVYVVGSTIVRVPYPPHVTALPGQCRSGSGGDAFVHKYDPDGTELWTREFGTSYAASASAVAVDTAGVYVVGQDEPSGLGVSQAIPKIASSAFLAKFEKSTAMVTESRPRILPDCVVNAASYVGGGVVPGEIVAIFGSAMGPSDLRLTEDRMLATTLAGTRILFNGLPAPLLYVSDKQNGTIVPYGIAGSVSVDVQVEYQGVRSDPVTVPVLASRPGIFSVDGSGQGQGAILNEDGSLNSPSNPAQRGSVVTLYATGAGETASGVVDGQILGDVLPRTSLPVSAFFNIGDCDVDEWLQSQGEVLYAGGMSGSIAGVLQVKLRVPPDAMAGDAVGFALVIGSQWEAFQVTIALR